MQLPVEIGVAEDRGARGAVRESVSLSATVRRQGDSGTRVTLLDLSTDGFRLDVANNIPPGSYVWLRLPGLSPLDARVAWCEGFQVGARFVNSLHPAVVARIVALDANG